MEAVRSHRIPKEQNRYKPARATAGVKFGLLPDHREPVPLFRDIFMTNIVMRLVMFLGTVWIIFAMVAVAWEKTVAGKEPSLFTCYSVICVLIVLAENRIVDEIRKIKK